MWLVPRCLYHVKDLSPWLRVHLPALVSSLSGVSCWYSSGRVWISWMENTPPSGHNFIEYNPCQTHNCCFSVFLFQATAIPCKRSKHRVIFSLHLFLSPNIFWKYLTQSQEILLFISTTESNRLRWFQFVRIIFNYLLGLIIFAIIYWPSYCNCV